MATRRQLLIGSSSAILTATDIHVRPFSATAADAYPNRPITLVVPFAAGGSTDILGRIVTERMGQLLGQRFLVENVSGAGGTTGTSRVARATPDGYTLQVGQLGTHVAALALHKNLAYGPEDFAPIGLIALQPIVIATRNSLEAQDLNQFRTYAATHPDKLAMGHAGIGSITHFTCLFLNKLMGVQPAMVPFSSSGQTMNAIVGGHVDYACAPAPDAIPQLQAGTIKVLAVSSNQRLASMPGVPTAAEGGLSEFVTAPWFALFAPKNIPQDIQSRLVEALDGALNDHSVRERLASLGCAIPPPIMRGPDALAAMIRADVEKWLPIIQASVK